MALFRLEELGSVQEGGHITAYDLNSRGDLIGADVADWSGANRGRNFIRTNEGTQFPDPFAEGWEAWHLNDYRDLAGFFGDGSHMTQFVRRAAVVPGDGQPGIDVHALLQGKQPAWSQCTGINNRRQVCGFYTRDPSPVAPDSSKKGFVFNIETREVLYLEDRGLSLPAGISDTQRIVGGLGTSDLPGYAYDLPSAAMQILPFAPIAVSPNGEWVVGSAQSGDAFLWQQASGSVQLQGLVGFVRVTDVNDLGLAVGYSERSAEEGEVDYPVAVLIDREGAHDLNRLVQDTDWFLTYATAINDDGTILAEGIRDRGVNINHRESVLLHPLPEIDTGSHYLGFEQLFGSVAVGGPGVGLIGGKLRPIPPWEPEVWRLVWATLNTAERDVLAGLGLSRYAQQLSEPNARQALSELSQKLIVDSARKLRAGFDQPPRLKQAAPGRLPHLRAPSAHGDEADDRVWQSIDELLAKRKGRSESS